MEDSSAASMIDEAYEFSAPRFFDFVYGESESDVRKAEHWFQTALSCAPSPFMPSRVKVDRSLKIDIVCDFSDADQLQKSSELSDSSNSSPSKPKPHSVLAPIEIREEETAVNVAKTPSSVDVAKKDSNTNTKSVLSVDNETLEGKEEGVCTQDSRSVKTEKASSIVKIAPLNFKEKSTSSVKVELEACTPKPPTKSRKGDPILTESKKHQMARKIASLVKNPSAIKPKNQSQLSQPKGIKPTSVKRDTNVKKISGTSSLAEENQAIKRQKLDGGGSRQILNIKTQVLTHKTRAGQMGRASNLCSSIAKTSKEDRKIYVREPFVSTAEMMNKFQSNTRQMSLSHDGATSIMQKKSKLTLTRPKEPEFETSQRVRSTTVRSSAELEEEMMAKIPKFKACPLNTKILRAPTLPSLPRSTPQLPEFQEFHLETMARVSHNAETSTVASTKSSSHQNNQLKPDLADPKAPVLHTSLRARPPRVKSTQELELEELEKAPKFKALPLNKKIFESKGELGMFCNTKRNVTVPQEFHFAIDERIPPPAPTVADVFDKLSLNSGPQHDNPIPRITMPNPFQLQTDGRGAEKERKFAVEIMQKQLEEEKARVPKAKPYPYTTDFPVIPPKPEPKQCTKLEPFQLESLVRHEEEMQREMEEQLRIKKEETQMRIFKARPVLKEDPIPVHEKVRKPLTLVQEFNLNVNHRAVHRVEFDKKIKEKELKAKRYREERESEKMMEEEKELKQLRRTMVPHARPVPDFNHPFLPQKSMKATTMAKSPNLLVVQRKESRRMRSTLAAISSPAAHMR